MDYSNLVFNYYRPWDFGRTGHVQRHSIKSKILKNEKYICNRYYTYKTLFRSATDKVKM